MSRLPTVYIPHGGGPCFFMDEPMGGRGHWDRMAAYLRTLGDTLPSVPEALLVISAHWETDPVTVNAAPAPPLLFDYHGFPPETYRLTWPAPGHPVLAARVGAMLAASGIDTASDTTRGFDHGVFVPLKLTYPEADVPVVQVSLHASLDPALHLRIGAALTPLRDEGVFIVGSGMSFHDMRAFGRASALEVSRNFDAWLTETLEHADPGERARRLTAWAQAPGGRLSHPREEHLLPLMVVAGAAGSDSGRHTFTDVVLGAAVSAFEFG